MLGEKGKRTKVRAVEITKRSPIAVAVFGTSTPFAFWGFSLVCRVVEALVGPVHHIHGSSLASLRDGWKDRGDRSIVFTSDLPDVALSHFLLANGLPTVVFLDDPRDAVYWAIASRNLDPENAIRFSTRTFASMAEPFTNHDALIIRRWKTTDVPEIVRAVALHIGGAGNDEETDSSMQRLAGADAAKGSPSLADNLKAHGAHISTFVNQLDLPEESKRLIDKSIAGYRPLFEGKWPSRISWPVELFFTSDSYPAFLPLDITGPARYLIYGPYMYLPCGRWNAEIVFEIIDNVSGLKAIADVVIDDVVVQGIIRMPSQGIFSYLLPFEVLDPQRQIELRLAMDKGAIEGKFLWRSVTMISEWEVDERNLGSQVSRIGQFTELPS
jgi:hypothetical protein